MTNDCICSNVPRIWRLAGVTRTVRLTVTKDGSPYDFTGLQTVLRIDRDNSDFHYEPQFTVEGDDNNIIVFAWAADKQPLGDYTIEVTVTDGSGNKDRVNWHGATGVRLVEYSNLVKGEDAAGVESDSELGLDGIFTMNGVGMDAYEEWLADGNEGSLHDYILWMQGPAREAAEAAEATMTEIQSRADDDHTTAGSDHTRAAADHTTATGDHTRAEEDHTRAISDHTRAAQDHTSAVGDHMTAGQDHLRAEADHTTAGSDHTRAESDHATAASDHSTAASDHTKAGQDSTRAGSDHDIAVADHAQAEADHTRAESDHTTAAADHTTAASDHTTASSDHTTAAADHTQAVADHAVMAGYDTRLTNVETDVTQLGQEVNTGYVATEQTPSLLTKLQIDATTNTFKSTTSGSVRIYYVPCAQGQFFRVTATSTGNVSAFRAAYSDAIPAAGGALTVLFNDSLTSADFIVETPGNGYFSVYCNATIFPNVKIYAVSFTDLYQELRQERAAIESLPNSFVKRDGSRQYLTDAQKSAIQYNIGIADGVDLVRKNIGNIDIGEYANADGVLTPLANTANIKIPIDGSKGFFFIRVFGIYYNVNYTFRFYDASDNNIAVTLTNATNGKLNGLYIVPIPVSASYIRLNVEPGKENLVQVFQDLPVPEFDMLSDKELITDKDGHISIGFVSAATGEVGVNNNLKSTIPIPCNDGDTFRVSNWNGSYSADSFAGGVGCFLDADMNYLSTFYADTEVYDVVAPEGARYAVFTYAINNEKLISVKRNATAAKVKILSTGVLKNSMWNGKIWVGFGASMVAQSSSYVGLKWSPMVEAATGLVFKNCGIGGTPLAGDDTNAFWKRIQPVIDYNPDVVTILGGYNDLYYDIPLGTSAEFDKAVAEKDCETFLGAYSYIVETLLNWKKSLRIVLMTPSYAHTNGADHTPGIGLTYKDYADATIQVAEYYCLPVIDLYRNMGINKLTQGTTYTRGDKIHWNARASQIAASLVIAKLEEINNAVPTE